MSIIKGLFLGLKNQKVIPFNQMTPELHDQISRGLAKIMMAAKMTNAKLTKSQQNYIMNQAKQVQEFEDRYITKIKDKFGNLIKKEKVADVFDLEGKTLDPSKAIMGGTQEGAAFKSGIMKATKTGPKKVETEAEILARIKKENKEAAEKLREKRIKEKMDDIKEIEDPEDMATGGRAGFKEGRIARILKSLKPFGSENKFSNQLEGILYGEMGLAEGLNLLSQSGLFAEGGRIGYKDGPEKPGRRTFMKAAAGLASILPFGIGKGVKMAAPVVAKAAEISGPALAKLVETVMSAGKLISLTGTRVKNMVTRKKLGKVEVEENIEDGSYIIKKDGKEIYYKPGRQDEMGIEDDIIEVIEERVKKADGGLGYMLGE